MAAEGVGSLGRDAGQVTPGLASHVAAAALRGEASGGWMAPALKHPGKHTREDTPAKPDTQHQAWDPDPKVLQPVLTGRSKQRSVTSPARPGAALWL